MADERVSLPLLRGVVDAADCGTCPLALYGMPRKPVCGEGPEDPQWIIIGEGPGAFETNRDKPFIGPSGQVVNQILGKIGADRSQLWVTNATLCVEGPTQVRLGDGSLRRIDQLVATRYTGDVQTLDANGNITTRRVVGWHRNRRGAREMRDVSFRWAQRAGANGRTHAVVTEDHPVWTPSGWQSAADVAGGLIATGDRAPSAHAQQIAYGTLLGDGTLQRGALVVTHAVDQRAYALAKANALAGFGSTVFEPNRGVRNVQDKIGFRTHAGAWGHATRDLFYPDGKKRIPLQVISSASDLLFAIWYLDDGSMCHRPPRRPNAEICGAGFLEDDLRAAANVLAARGFENSVRNGRINFTVESTARFSRAIASFVPPEMEYKLRPEDRGLYDPTVYRSTAAVPFFDVATSVLRSPRRKGEDAVVYCLDVDETHNFITPGAVVHNCTPPSGADVQMREQAAVACRGRLMNELSWFPGKPILTLGAVAARAVIPKATLDAIEPPETAKALKKAQKLRQQPTLKAARARRKAITKEAERRLKKLIKHRRTEIITRYKVQHRARPPEHVLVEEVVRVQAQLERKANEDAIKHVDAKIAERKIKAAFRAAQPKKKKKPKQVKITDICGTLFDVDVDGTGVRPVIPGIHPAALLRGGGASIGGSHTPDMAFVNLMYDAGKIQSLANGKDIRLKLNVAYELTDPARIGELFLRVYHSALDEGACSIDLETYVDDPDRHHALMAYVAKIKVIGIATKEMTISLAWEFLPEWAKTLLQVLLSKVVTTYHNGLYDRTVLRAYGYVLRTELFDDTLLGHHAAFPGNSHRLQVVASQFYGVGPWKSEYRNQEETLEGLAEYNAKDTGATHALRAPLAVWRKRTKTERVYGIDRKMSDCASWMHLAGMPVDQDINSQLLATFSKNVTEARRHVEDIARDPHKRELIWHYLATAQAHKKRKLDPDDYEARYNLRLEAMRLDPDWKWKIGAGKHIAALLQAMGVELVERTESGDISTKKDVLESLVGAPIVRDILAFRENDKLLSTFIWPAFDRRDPKTGEILTYGYADERSRIHPIWNVHRISGRWASQWPVVSNVPKDKWKKLTPEEVLALGVFEVGPDNKFTINGQLYRFNAKDSSFSKMTRPNLRAQIRARPGRIFVGFDFAQIEARVIALISGDPFLMDVFADPTRDIHIECARIIWEMFDSLDPDTRKQLRENVKNIEYGYFYMAQLDTLHQTMLKAGNIIKKADLARAIAKLAAKLSRIVQWQQNSIRIASTPPYEIADFILGRRRVWPMGNVEGGEAVNYGVQTAASAIMNTGMMNMMPLLDNYLEVDPIGQFHDAAIFECWEDDAPRLAEDVKIAFTQVYEREGRSVPFSVDVKIGQSWDKV